MDGSPKYVNFGEAIKLFFTNYFNFRDRSTRSEYWYSVLFQFIVGFVIGLIAPAISGLVELVFLIPSYAVLVRRLHDVNKSGKLVLLPAALAIILLIIVGPGIFTAISSGNYDALSTSAALIGVFSLVIFAFEVYLLVLCCKKGDSSTNKYGRSADETNFY